MCVKLSSGDLNQNNIAYDCQKKKKNWYSIFVSTSVIYFVSMF